MVVAEVVPEVVWVEVPVAVAVVVLEVVPVVVAVVVCDVVGVDRAQPANDPSPREAMLSSISATTEPQLPAEITRPSNWTIISLST